MKKEKLDKLQTEDVFNKQAKRHSKKRRSGAEDISKNDEARRHKRHSKHSSKSNSRKHRKKSHSRKEFTSQSSTESEDEWVEAGDSEQASESQVEMTGDLVLPYEGNEGAARPPNDTVKDKQARVNEKATDNMATDNKSSAAHRESHSDWPPRTSTPQGNHNMNVSEGHISTLTWRQKALLRIRGEDALKKDAGQDCQPATQREPVKAGLVTSKSRQALKSKMIMPGQVSNQADQPNLKEPTNGKSLVGTSADTAQLSAGQSLSENILTAEQLNRLSAQLVKAEIMGDTELASKLKEKLDGARHSSAAQQTGEISNNTPSNAEHVIMAAPVHDRPARPLALAPDLEESSRRTKVDATHNTDGQRDAYYAKDKDQSLLSLVEKEKYGDRHDYDLELVKNMANMGDEHYDSDIFVGLRESKQSEMERETARAVAAHRRANQVEDQCRLCLGQRFSEHLVVSIGYKTYLAVSPNQNLAKYECVVVPMEHVTALNLLDEDVQSELRMMKKYLVRMGEALGLCAVFLETAEGPGRKRHAQLQCVFVERELGDLAPIYFKKAMTEAMSEWSANRKIVTTTNGVCPVPSHFAYFHVQFGTDMGYAMATAEADFKPTFGKEILGGMLDVEPRLWMRPALESRDQQRRKCAHFSLSWQPFDWTTTIDQ